MIRAALTLAAVLAATAANAQKESNHYQNNVDPEAGLPLYQRKFMPPPDPIGDVPPGWTLTTLAPPPVNGWLPPQPPTMPAPEPVVMLGGKGGLIAEHYARFWALKRQGATVEMRGGCWSACTLITSFIPKDRLCFAAGSFLAFHSARAPDSVRPQLQSTLEMYVTYPAEIRQWIDRHGGPYKMTVESYWTMYDRDLWAIGYPRCK
jgi:hypothetical protein